MSKKEMPLSFALDLLYQEATSEETKYTQKQKETAYNVLSDNLLIMTTLKYAIKLHEDIKKRVKDCLSDFGKECLEEWLNK